MNQLVGSVAPIAIWSATVVGSGVIGWMVRAFLDRSKPRVEIASIAVDNRIHDDRSVSIPGSVLDAYNTLPLIISDFSERMKLTELNQACEYLRLTQSQFLEALGTIRDAINIVDGLAGDTDKRVLRSKILTCLERRGAISIDNVVSTALIQIDVQDEFVKMGAKQDYTKHPSLSELTNFGLKEFRHNNWSLAEGHLEEIKDPSPRDEWALSASNVFKRVLIYCEKHILKYTLELTEAEFRKTLDQVSSMLSSLETILQDNNPSHVWIEIVISNHGKTPVIFDGAAFLDIETATVEYSVEFARAEQIQSSPIVVKGDDSGIFALKSSKPSTQSLALVKKNGDRIAATSATDVDDLVGSNSHKFRISLVRRTSRGQNKEIRSDFFVRR